MGETLILRGIRKSYKVVIFMLSFNTKYELARQMRVDGLLDRGNSICKGIE